ncbi:DUF2931 family protein [Flavobacterium hibisci]|uniref:DUF2931 family protein n=1 Tax=Flavobacterium hibisci TaxID=1914462 RepID=UPI001CBF96C2|nr:DUF2931 family protein [Flavobacterium hibisci]MBZ4041652.1 DUF2931 family protein [Flavobacterium hibisci]
MEEKKYNWTAAVCTPKNYPAEIFSGHLLLSDQPKSGYVYMPFNRIINSEDLGDNDGSSSGEATGIAPKILDITWLSYTENKSYSGIFKLDSEKIEALMINGNERPYWDVETKKVGIVKDYYFVINAGLFPGGMVVLYVFSQSNMIIVGRYQAYEDKTVDWGIAHETMKDKEGITKYVNYMNEDLPQDILDQIKNGTIPFGYWETLFKKYPITPIVKKEDKVETIGINYINGEFESIFLSLNGNVMPIKERAVPRKINIVWHDVNDRRMESDIFFDEKKSKALFETIKAEEKIKFIIEIDRNTKPRETKGISIKLKTATTEIDMKDAIISQESFTKPTPY